MTYRKPKDLDGFIQLMPKADMRVKTQLAEDLATFLSDDTNSILCTDVGILIDNLMPWLTGSNFKIAQKSLEVLTELIKRMGAAFNPYTAKVLPHVINRLGDSKDTVREKAQVLLQQMMENRVLTPQALLDKLANSCLKHKNSKVREEFLQTIVNTLNEYGTAQLSVRNYIQLIAKHLLGDPAAVVRESAIQTLVEIYKHVGDRLCVDLRRSDDVPAAKLALLEQKFDQVKGEGLLLKSALLNSANNGHDEADHVAVNVNMISSAKRERPSRIVKRTVTANRRKMPIAEIIHDASAFNMDLFEASFEAVPRLNISKKKDIDDVYKGVFMVISDKNTDWEKRVEALKKLRSLLLLNAQSQPHFVFQLKDLAFCFLDILKEELRSQVICEACITIAYFSKTLRLKLQQFCTYILDQLILLIRNSAKVIALSSLVALKYIVKYTHAPKLIKIITDNLSQSKSKDIRANLCEILCLLLQEWPSKAIERYATLLRDTIKKSIADADNETRRYSRRAYWLYREHFPELAAHIYGTLDIATRRAWERERDGSNYAVTASGSLTNRNVTTTQPSSSLPSPSSLQKPTAFMRSKSAAP